MRVSRLVVCASVALALLGAMSPADAGSRKPVRRGEAAASARAQRARKPRPARKPQRSLRPARPAKPPLRRLVARLLQGKRLVIASKTGMYTFAEDGSATRGSGGVVTALASMDAPLAWVAAPAGAGDRNMAAGGETREVGDTRLRFFDVPDDVMDGAINQVSNPILWFTQHGMLDLLESRDRASWNRGWSQYVEANRSYAATVAEELSRSDAAPYAIIHDYQLYLTPGELRRLRPETKILHFTHIPWPAPEKWAALRRPTWVRQVCESLLASDIVGFQTARDVRNFIDTAERHVPGLRVRRDARGDYLVTLRRGAKPARVRHYPISIDPTRVRQTYQEALAQGYPRQAEVQAYRRSVDHLVVRIDRLDPSKSTLEGFQAYAQLLARRPDLRGKVGMLAVLVPSRENVSEYAGYKAKVLELVEEINRTYGGSTWEPIHVINENDYPRALAAMGEADVMLVNSKEDGMNLVSKEFSIVNTTRPKRASSRVRRVPGVLALSPTTGAWEELGPGAIAAGADPDQASHALEEALEMKPAERRRRAALLAKIVRDAPISSWTAAQVEDFLRLGP